METFTSDTLMAKLDLDPKIWHARCEHTGGGTATFYVTRRGAVDVSTGYALGPGIMVTRENGEFTLDDEAVGGLFRYCADCDASTDTCGCEDSHRFNMYAFRSIAGLVCDINEKLGWAYCKG